MRVTTIWELLDDSQEWGTAVLQRHFNGKIYVLIFQIYSTQVLSFLLSPVSGIAVEGLGSILDGMFGTGNGTTSTSINVGVVGITKVTHHDNKIQWKLFLHFETFCTMKYFKVAQDVAKPWISWFNWPNSQIAPCTSPISHNAPFCNRNVHISVTKWCIVGSLADALWDLWDGPINSALCFYKQNFIALMIKQDKKYILFPLSRSAAVVLFSSPLSLWSAWVCSINLAHCLLPCPILW